MGRVVERLGTLQSLERGSKKKQLVIEKKLRRSEERKEMKGGDDIQRKVL